MSYTESQAYPGRSSTIAVSDGGSPEVWTAIGECKDVNPSGEKIDSYDASNFESGIDKEWIAGMIDHGDLTVMLNHIPSDAGQQLLRTYFQAGTKKTWGVKLPDSSIVSSSNTVPYYATFTAFISQLNLPKLATNALAEASFVLKITGPVTEHQEGTVAAPF